MPEITKFVYMFEEGNQKMVDLLGGKGAGLSEMKNIGLNVPPGFTITTEACRQYMSKLTYPDGMMDQVSKALKKLESLAGRKFGDENDPLLVQVNVILCTILVLHSRKLFLEILVRYTQHNGTEHLQESSV